MSDELVTRCGAGYSAALDSIARECCERVIVLAGDVTRMTPWAGDAVRRMLLEHLGDAINDAYVMREGMRNLLEGTHNG